MKKRNLILTINVLMQPHQLVAMHENGVDLSTVSGKGNDVVRKDDVENSQKQLNLNLLKKQAKEEPKNLQVHLINL